MTTPDTTARSDAWHSTALQAATEGLLYTSEGDAPFAEVFIPGGGAQWPPSPDAFASLVGADGAAAAEQTTDRFFARHIDHVSAADPVMLAMKPRYEALRDLLAALLRDVRVFRVGTVEVLCYVVGVDSKNDVSGMSTVSIET
jgi:hypothetical protein